MTFQFPFKSTLGTPRNGQFLTEVLDDCTRHRCMLQARGMRSNSKIGAGRRATLPPI